MRFMSTLCAVALITPVAGLAQTGVPRRCPGRCGLPGESCGPRFLAPRQSRLVPSCPSRPTRWLSASSLTPLSDRSRFRTSRHSRSRAASIPERRRVPCGVRCSAQALRGFWDTPSTRSPSAPMMPSVASPLRLGPCRLGATLWFPQWRAGSSVRWSGRLSAAGRRTPGCPETVAAR